METELAQGKSLLRWAPLCLENPWPHHDHAIPDSDTQAPHLLSPTLVAPKRWACLKYLEEDLQDGRQVRHGDQLPPNTYIKNTYTGLPWWRSG